MQRTKTISWFHCTTASYTASKFARSSGDQLNKPLLSWHTHQPSCLALCHAINVQFVLWVAPLCPVSFSSRWVRLEYSLVDYWMLPCGCSELGNGFLNTCRGSNKFVSLVRTQKKKKKKNSPVQQSWAPTLDEASRGRLPWHWLCLPSRCESSPAPPGVAISQPYPGENKSLQSCGWPKFSTKKFMKQGTPSDGYRCVSCDLEYYAQRQSQAIVVVFL